MSKNDIDSTQNSENYSFGVHYDMPDKQYRLHKGVSATSIPIIRNSFCAFDNKNLFCGWSPAYSWGSLFHTSVLEPHLLNIYIEASTIGADSISAQTLQSQHPDKIVIGNNQVSKAVKQADNLKVIYGDIIAACKKEVSVIVDDRDNSGLIWKCRPDLLLESHRTVLDLKSSASGTREEFVKTIEKYDYDIQAAFYIDCCQMARLNVEKFGWIVQPSNGNAPFSCIASDELIEKGRAKYQDLLYGYSEYKKGAVNDNLFPEVHSWSWILEQRRTLE